MGTGERSERIRTYNFPQNRITDHRVGLSKFGLEQMLSGELLGDFVEALAQQERVVLLEQLETSDPTRPDLKLDAASAARGSIFS